MLLKTINNFDLFSVELSQYKMFIIFEGICSIEKLYNIFIPTDARQASVIAGCACFPEGHYKRSSSRCK